MKPLEKSIIQTLAYFDIFAHPLSREELYRFLWKERGDLCYEEFVLALDDMLEHNAKIAKKNGYYFLAGKEEYIAEREARIQYLESKMKIARRAAKVFRFIPFIRAMFVCNQLAVGVSPESDIDVFIVVKKHRLWITRLLTTVIASICGFRRHGKHVNNHICLSFYVTDDAINLEPVRIDRSVDVYLAYWLCQLIPVYDPEDIQTEILQYNTWMHRLLPYAHETQAYASRWMVQNNRLSRMLKGFFEIAWKGAYGEMINTQAKGIQEKKMRRNRKSKLNRDKKDTGVDVVVSDQMLKFHENDRRALFFDQWKERCARFGISVS